LKLAAALAGHDQHEKLADRLTTDHDPQIGRVKDMGSAAVGVALVTAGLFWLFSIAERMGVI
jgi:diacylglycerol kinase (ATP)